ncbi:MAG: hypothetical protein K1V76_00670 [Candidatus Amulumruptor sp.]
MRRNTAASTNMNNATNPMTKARRRRGSRAKPHARSVSERSWGQADTVKINLGEVVTQSHTNKPLTRRKI